MKTSSLGRTIPIQHRLRQRGRQLVHAWRPVPRRSRNAPQQYDRVGLGNDRDLLDLAAVTVLMTLEMDLLAVAGGLQL